MKKKRKLGRKLLSILLSLALMLGLMPGMSMTAYATTYSDSISDNLQEGDILKPGARYHGGNITVILQANGWGDENEMSNSEKQFSVEMGGLEISENDNGSIWDAEYNNYYPYANGEKVSAWKVVSFVGGENPWDPKTITLTGFAPPAREPVRVINSDTTLSESINGYITITDNVTLDLAGYTITGGGYHSTIIINVGCTLTLTDSSTGKTGKITGGGGDAGGGVAVNNDATFNMQGGTISGNTATNGGGVAVGGDATFNMSGGTITGNSADNGGGVYSSGSSFSMTGGTISNNHAGDLKNGGGVLIQSGNFSMSGTAAITGNYGGKNGGGVYNSGTFNMTGGSISGGNYATSGGGVYNRGTFNMTGGTITGNRTDGWAGGGVYNGSAFNMSGSATITSNLARTEGGGVYSIYGTVTVTGGSITSNTSGNKGYAGVCIQSGTFTLSGGPVIDGNTHGGTEEDICLYPNTVVTVTNALTMENTMSVRRTDSNGNDNWIGVIAQGSGYTLAEADGAKFVASTTSRRAKYDSENSKEILVALYTVTYNINGATSGTVPTDENNPYESGSTVTVLGNTGNLAKTSHNFNGWNTAANGSGSLYAAGDTFDITGNTTLYAQWEEVSHVHSFTYSAEDGTITATCTDHDGCPLADSDYKATLTISANGGTYDGTTSYEATVTDENSIKGDAVVNYYKADENGERGEALSPLTTAPTNAGRYWAEITLGTGDNAATAHVVYTIEKAAETAPAESFTISKATGSDTIDGKISGFAGTKTYQISSDNGATWTDVKAGETSLVVKAGVYQIRYAGDKNHEAGASVSVTVGKKADQSKPEGLEAVNVSAEDAKDGEIIGVSDTMEYSVDKGTTWKAVPANADKIDGLAAGEVLVRYAETDDKNAGSNTTVTVGVASKTEGVVEFKQEEGGTDVEEKAITDVDNKSTKASVDDFAETQQEEGKDVKVVLEITTQKEENVNKESVEETNKVVEEVFAGIDSEKVVTEYLAIDVAKYVDNVKETENISDTKSPLEIALKFDSKKSNPVVVRTHDGKAKAFGKLRSRPAKKDYKDAMFYIDPENAILYIYSQYFSDFAIVYATETTYNVGFVSGTGVNLSPLVVAEGGKVTLPTGLKNDGYAFDGWYQDEAYKTAWKDSDTVNADITLYAKWNKSVSGVSVSPSEAMFTKAGETSQIKTTVTPADAANTKVTYKSSDTNVATVDANGKITAVANGTATITVTTEDGAKTATVKVTVSIPEVKQQGTEEPVQQPTKEEKAVISMNAGLKISQTGSKINIKWGKVGEADGYDVYVAYCGKKFGKAVKTINKNSTTSVTVKKINSKKINLKKNFKVYVAAYKMTDGKKEVLAKSIMGHVVGRLNTRYSNVWKITLSKSKYSVKVGKTVKVKAKTVLVDKSKKQLSDAHAAQFRYASSNRNIATVDKNGKVKGVAKGTCTIYVYARNGYAKTVKVTVK